jgi:DNA-directed RNA polymerase specialized sigma24 family protein
LADETLSRVASKIEEKGEIVGVSPAHYCYITAKFVFLESLRGTDRHRVGLQDAQGGDAKKPGSPMPGNLDSEALDNQKRLACLEQCLSKLTPGDRELILEYHRNKGREKIERRAGLAERLGLTMNALTIRACRIRSKLEACVTACSKGV